jgi:hypothetical protein
VWLSTRTVPDKLKSLPAGTVHNVPVTKAIWGNMLVSF